MCALLAHPEPGGYLGIHRYCGYQDTQLRYPPELVPGGGSQLPVERKRMHLASFPAKSVVAKLQIKNSPHAPPPSVLFVLGAAEQEGQSGQLPLRNSDRGWHAFRRKQSNGGNLVAIAELRGVLPSSIVGVF